jgi:cytochrome c553
MRFSRTALPLLVGTLVALSALAAPPKKPANAAQIERGKYLVSIAACNDCHSPKDKPGSMMPDPARFLSGRPSTTPAPAKPVNPGEISASGDLTAWFGPWGVSYTANLTPDPKTGLGKRYNEASFIKTIRTGKKPEGEDLLPPMPWQVYANMTDEDLKAVWAYLQTLKPIVNNVKVSPPPPIKK